MKAINKIQAPKSFYYEDKDGNNISFDTNKGFPEKWHVQHYKGVQVIHSICFAGNKNGKDKWPVKFVKWALKNMPNKWLKPEPSMTFTCTINNAYPLIKYLVEQRNFSFSDACITISEMCGRCGDIIDAEMNGTQFQELRNPHMHCQFCNTIDPAYTMRRRIWCCHRTMKLGGDIAKAWKDKSVESSKYYFHPDTKPRRMLGWWHYLVGHTKVGWGLDYLTCLECDKRWPEKARPKAFYNPKTKKQRYVEWWPKKDV